MPHRAAKLNRLIEMSRGHTMEMKTPQYSRMSRVFFCIMRTRDHNEISGKKCFLTRNDLTKKHTTLIPVVIVALILSLNPVYA